MVRAAALFYPRAQRIPGARRGPRPWATPRGEAAYGELGFSLYLRTVVLCVENVLRWGIAKTKAPRQLRPHDACFWSMLRINVPDALVAIQSLAYIQSRPTAYIRKQELYSQGEMHPVNIPR